MVRNCHMAHSDRCIRSTRPFAAGWKAVMRERCIPHMLARAWKRWDSNCRSWSVVMVCGHPKRAIHPDSRARAAVSTVISVMGMASGQHVKWCTAVRQYLKPSDVGSGPTMSTCTCWKRDVGREKLPGGVLGNFLSLTRLACSGPDVAFLLHARPHVAMEMSLAVTLILRWPCPWRESNTFH
jgi:hypothetical protein